MRNIIPTLIVTLMSCIAGCASKPPPAILGDIDSALRSADFNYREDIAHSRELLVARLEAAKHVATRSDQPDQIDQTRNALLSDSPAPEIGEHHLEMLPPIKVGPSDARAAVLSYKADLELAHRRWLDATASLRSMPMRILEEELTRALQSGDDQMVAQLWSRELCLITAYRGIPTTWYREKPQSAAPGKSPIRSLPVAMAIRNVEISHATIGQQFEGNFTARVLVESYNDNPQTIGPSYYLLIYDGDKIVFYAGGGWNGTHDVDSEITLSWDTHSTVLVAAHGDPFQFTKPGTYTMRLILANGGGWDDVLDVYDRKFTVALPATQP